MTALDKQIYKSRMTLMSGVSGGMPLNMTLPAMCRTRTAAVTLLPKYQNFGSIILGMGDGLVSVLFQADPYCIHVGGVEFSPDGGEWGLRAHFINMSSRLIGFDPSVVDSMVWNTDVLSLSSLNSMLLPAICLNMPLIAYGFDDSIPVNARKHWYSLLQADERVKVVCTTFHGGLRLDVLLPDFVQRHKYKVRLEGGKCCRTMLILKRAKSSM
jgi:hypothetical protein